MIRRVCEDTPRSLQELNPEIPAWLINIIEKLLAKDPQSRFQSAAEVADLLSGHLAHLQYPTIAPKPRFTAPTDPMRCADPPLSRRPGWLWVAAPALIVLACIIIIVIYKQGTETSAAAPDGNHGVSVAVERPAADAEPPTLPPIVSDQQGAFMLLGSEGTVESQFDSLNEAVALAHSGDTIEIRGDGPFLAKGIDLGLRDLIIRAGDGYRPTIRLDTEDANTSENLIFTRGRLVLEGLGLQRLGSGDSAAWSRILRCQGGALYVAYCRLLQTSGKLCIGIADGTTELRHSEVFLEGSELINHGLAAGGRLVIDNCLLAGGSLVIRPETVDARNGSIEITNSTLVGKDRLFVYQERRPARHNVDDDAKIWLVSASNNAFVSSGSVLRFEQSANVSKLPPLSRHDAESLLAKGLSWQGNRNAYDAGNAFIDSSVNWEQVQVVLQRQDLAQWRQFWRSEESESTVHRVWFKGGVLRGKSAVELAQMTPDAFHLRHDSAGYDPDANRSDVGVDTRLLGPGEPYHRWKTSPQYQQWLKLTGQYSGDAAVGEVEDN